MYRLGERNFLRILTAATIALLMTASNRAFAQNSALPSTPPPTLLVDEKLDYSKLYNNVYNYNDIIVAKASGFNDDDVARGVKIARRTGVPFRHIVDRRATGESWGGIADKARLPRTELRHLDKEKDEIAAYEAAYFATGAENSPRNTKASIRAQVSMMPKPKR